MACGAGGGWEVHLVSPLLQFTYAPGFRVKLTAWKILAVLALVLAVAAVAVWAHQHGRQVPMAAQQALPPPVVAAASSTPEADRPALYAIESEQGDQVKIFLGRDAAPKEITVIGRMAAAFGTLQKEEKITEGCGQDEPANVFGVATYQLSSPVEAVAALAGHRDLSGISQRPTGKGPVASAFFRSLQDGPPTPRGNGIVTVQWKVEENSGEPHILQHTNSTQENQSHGGDWYPSVLKDAGCQTDRYDDLLLVCGMMLWDKAILLADIEETEDGFSPMEMTAFDMAGSRAYLLRYKEAVDQTRLYRKQSGRWMETDAPSRPFCD